MKTPIHGTREEAIRQAIDQLAMSKTDILVITRALMIRYGQQLETLTVKYKEKLTH